MAKFFRYLVSIAAHVVWQRSGKVGSLPAFKAAPGQPTTRLPVPSAWQIMAVTWILERLWQAFGDDVKHKLTHTKSPVVNRLGEMLPAPNNATQAPPTQSSVSSTPQPVVKTAPRYDTQKLPPDTLPPGSVLGSLRSS